MLAHPDPNITRGTAMNSKLKDNKIGPLPEKKGLL